MPSGRFACLVVLGGSCDGSASCAGCRPSKYRLSRGKGQATSIRSSVYPWFMTHKTSESAPDDAPPRIEALLETAWASLRDGVADARHGWHQAAIASIGTDGGPDARTVVVRSADQGARTVGFHTDLRSGKIERFRADSRVGLLFYDRALRIQLRASGRATVHEDDSLADAAWARSSLSSRRCYLAPMAPSSPIDAFSPNLPSDLLHRVPDEAASEAGRDNFALILCHLDVMEWLHLRHDGHVRARFSWDASGACSSTWLAP